MAREKQEISKQLLDILHHYKDHTLAEIVEDIYTKIGGDQPRSTTSMRFSQKTIKSINVDDLVKLTQEEIVNYLNSASKSDLLSLSKSLGIKLNTKESKELISESILSYIGFINLNRKMAVRDAPESSADSNRGR